MNRKISVIVPVYNVETYLEECVSSIVKQTFGDFEIILVDDGSTDNSGNICDNLTVKYSGYDIKVIHKPNGGLSSARNEGIKVSCGEYLCFIDSDDCIRENFLEALLEGCSRGAKMAVCPIEKFKDGSAYDISAHAESGITKIITASQYASMLYDLIAPEYVYAVIAMNKLYHRTLFENTEYPEGKLHEDEFVIYKIVSDSETVAFVDCPLYLYRQRDNSITGSQNILDERHLDVIEAYKRRIGEAVEIHDLLTAEITLRNCLLKICDFAGVFKDNIETGKKLKTEYKEIYKQYHHIFPAKRRIKYFVLGFKI